MTAVLFATHPEARPLLERLAAEPVPARPFDTWRFASAGGGLIVVGGMGGAAAGRATAYALDQPDVGGVVNAGICGSLRGGEPGALFAVSEALDGDAWLAGGRAVGLELAPGSWTSLRRARLATVGEPVFDATRQQALAAVAELVDMEGFAVARVCRDRGAACHMVKGVSDRANEEGKAAIIRNLPSVCEALAETVTVELSHRASCPPPETRPNPFSSVLHAQYSE
jgi:nucleoside phosphorylase